MRKIPLSYMFIPFVAGSISSSIIQDEGLGPVGAFLFGAGMCIVALLALYILAGSGPKRNQKRKD